MSRVLGTVGPSDRGSGTVRAGAAHEPRKILGPTGFEQYHIIYSVFFYFRGYIALICVLALAQYYTFLLT